MCLSAGGSAELGPPCIPRSCHVCGNEVLLTLSEADQLPPDSASCICDRCLEKAITKTRMQRRREESRALTGPAVNRLGTPS